MSWFTKKRCGTIVLDERGLHIATLRHTNSVMWDLPFVLHLSQRPLGASSELSITLRQGQSNSVGFRTIVSSEGINPQVPHKNETFGHIAYSALERIWPALSYYGSAHDVSGFGLYQLRGPGITSLSSSQQMAPRAAKPSLIFTSPDCVVATPGEGIQGIHVGVSTYREALETFGYDCKVHCYNNGSFSGEKFHTMTDLRVWRLCYAYNVKLEYEPDRDRNQTRPSDIECDSSTGVIERLAFGVYQNKVVLDRNIPTNGTLRQMIAAYGDAYKMKEGDPLSTYTYPNRGLSVWVHTERQKINSFYIIPRVERDVSPP